MSNNTLRHSIKNLLLEVEARDKKILAVLIAARVTIGNYYVKCLHRSSEPCANCKQGNRVMDALDKIIEEITDER